MLSSFDDTTETDLYVASAWSRDTGRAVAVDLFAAACCRTTSSRPSWHVIAPKLSRKINAGMVVTPKAAIRSFPRLPTESTCGIAVHGIVEKSCSVSRAVRHRETRTSSSVPSLFCALDAR
jgi:hypothetical protein